MLIIKWSLVKSEQLRLVRGVSFENVLSGKLVDVRASPNRNGQEIMMFEYRQHIWVVPFVRKGEEIFLKTAYPSRKYTRTYRRGRDKHEND